MPGSRNTNVQIMKISLFSKKRRDDFLGIFLCNTSVNNENTSYINVCDAL